MHTMSPIISANDRDGVGYAAITEQGIFMEHWLHPHDAFNNRHIYNKKDEELERKFKGVVTGGKTYRGFVEKKDSHKHPMQAVIMHARMATCEKSLLNVHPFYSEGIALVHNGVINNHEKLEKKYSTCDSEVILNSYVKHKVKEDIKHFDEVAKEISGYYGCGVLTRLANGTPVLDVFKAVNPSLSFCYIKELDAIVICTMQTMVKDGCQELGWEYGTFFSMEDDMFVRINAITGDAMERLKFKSKTSTYEYNYHNHRGEYYDYTSWNDKEEDAKILANEANKTEGDKKGEQTKVVQASAPIPLGDASQKKTVREIEMERLKQMSSEFVDTQFKSYTGVKH